MLGTFNPSSPMSMGAWALLGFSVCAFLAALFTLLEDTGRGRDLGRAKATVGIIGGLFGFFLAAYPGVLLGATTRPLWVNGHALGALFLAVGASSGAAAMALILAAAGRRAAESVARLNTMIVLAIVIQLVSVLVFLGAVQMSGSAASLKALEGLMSGQLAMLFWGGAIVVGSVVPLAIGLADMRRRSIGLTAVASVLVLVGGFLVKYVIMAAGQA
jgi:formate-dependent nitrite reductase membrane component NrfD